MDMNEEIFECFSLDYLNQKEGLNRTKAMNIKDFLKYDLSILSEREIVTTLVNIEVFSDNEKELIKFWATLFKSKKLFEIVEGSNLTDTDFVTRLKESSCSKQFVELVSSINWKCAAIDMNNEYVANIGGFYEEIAVKMARNSSLTVELIERFDLRGVDWNYKDSEGESLLICLCDKDVPNMDLVICLLDKEVDTNNTDRYGETAFVKLRDNSKVTLDMIKLFFEKSVGWKDANGEIAFMWLNEQEAMLCEYRYD